MFYKYSFQIVAVVMLLLNSMSCDVSTETPREKRILVIQSYEKHFSPYKEMKNILSGEFHDKGIQAAVYSFYLDCEQFSEKQQKQKIFNKLEELSSWKPDIILVNDDPALNALIACGHPTVKSIPVVFMGINYPNTSLIKKYPNITGFYDKPDFRTNIQLIKRLIGNCIVIRVTDESLQDNRILGEMNKQIKDICALNNIYSTNRVRLSGKNGISIANIPKIKPDSMYISTLNAKSTSALIKGFGENYYNKAYLATKRDYTTISLGRLSAFPCFSVVNELLGSGNGIVGGYMAAFEDQAHEAIRQVADLLRGDSLTGIPQMQQSKKSYLFDYKVLDKWEIDPGLLPNSAVILNMPFAVRYKFILTVLAIFISALLAALFIYQRRQYRKEARYKKEAQEKLRQEKAFLSFALESGNIFAFRYRDDIFEFDNEFYHAMGIPPETITTAQFLQTIHPDDRDAFLISRDMLDKGLTAPQIMQQRHDFNGKGYEWWEFRYAQNKDSNRQESNNGLVPVSGLCLNIQQIKSTENSLIQARRKAEESDRMKSVFLANMSHEIRTPLNAIVGFSQLLNSGMDLEPEEKKEFLDLISKNSDLLLKLINDILDLSRIESGCMSFSYENLDLNKLIEDVFHTHRLMMPENVELRMQIPDSPAIIHVDRLRLTQVCTNLINNARKFTSEGHILITYELSRNERFIHISVSDTGKGIPEDKKAMVFERFQKLDEFAQGTGLGLAICQSIIKTFDGRLTLDSKVGKGSTFTITLPYTPGLAI